MKSSGARRSSKGEKLACRYLVPQWRVGIQDDEVGGNLALGIQSFRSRYLVKAIATLRNECAQYLLRSVMNVQYVRSEVITARLGRKKPLTC